MATQTTSVTASAASAASILHTYVAPIIQGMCVFAGLVCAFFLINGGVQYMSSSGKPERMESAKIVIRNALIGLVIVFAAGALTTILAHSFHSSATQATTKLPSIPSVSASNDNSGLVGVLIKAIVGVLNDIIQTAAAPFLKALSYFTTATPLITDNSSVFNLWLAITGMADILFVLVIALLGFHVMSYSTLGLEEIELKHMLPQLAIVFALINSSVFVIDGVIELSNALIHALYAAFGQTSVWDVLTAVTAQASGYSLAALLIMVSFLTLSVILLVYYVMRIVTIYLGAVLSPFILLVWLIPGFRGFAETAFKTYITTIFLLFVHVVILELAASLFTGMLAGSPTHSYDPIMAMIIGLATLITLLKTQGVMMQLSYANIGLRTARKLGSQFLYGMSYIAGQGSNGIGVTFDRMDARLASRPSRSEMYVPVVGSRNSSFGWLPWRTPEPVAPKQEELTPAQSIMKTAEINRAKEQAARVNKGKRKA